MRVLSAETPIARETVVDDGSWFVQEVTPCLPRLYGTARRVTRNDADAEDLVAEAVAKAWTHRGSLHDRSRMAQWLCRILTNTFISRWRASPAGTETLPAAAGDDEETFSLFEPLHQPFLLWWGRQEQAFLDSLLREDIERAMDALPEPYRLAIVMCEMNGMSYAQIAQELSVPIGTVRSRLARARSMLQKALYQHGVDAGLVPNNQPRGAR
jgi:RNA polymerase sigma factor (sigma-70 family)